MSTSWGKVELNRQTGSWCVKGVWQGQRHYFSKYQSDLGPRVCQTEEEARLLQLIISSEIASGHFDPRRYKKNTPLRLRNFAETWLEQIRPTLRYSSWRTYKVMVRNWIIPLIGHVFLPDLRYGDYQDLWVKVPRSEKYRKGILCTLFLIMEDARRAGHISQVPEKIRFVGKFGIPVKDIVWLDRNTQETILEAIRPQDRPISEFMMITGVRPAEARALQKNDIRGDHILIRNTFTMNKGGEILGPVKQKKERRIPMYAGLQEILDRAGKGLSPFVFLNPRTGRPYTHNFNKDVWNPACRQVLGRLVALKNATRHSFGNQMSVAGVPMETVSAGLGHSGTAVTKRHYANPSMEGLRQAVDKVRSLSHLQPICNTKVNEIR
jgi:integrase